MNLHFANYALLGLGMLPGVVLLQGCRSETEDQHPNVILIYADDLGYGDVSCYGATRFSTPNIDRLASEGMKFVNAHSPSATCTPSRYAMLTGEYAWRREGTGIARGNASMIIDPGRHTLASVFKDEGYSTAVIGKWHLGLGGKEGPDWNGEIRPGPREIGFDYSFLIPATGDRVPCVFTENYHVVRLDPSDPITVSYDHPVGNDPTGRDHPELLKMHPSEGHNNTIVNGISRIGYMSGGNSARWTDENIADTLTQRALDFIGRHKKAPFFLYFSTHDIHVPRVPHPRFAGKSGLGPRGDAILQLDDCVGRIVNALREYGLGQNTIIIFTSDNGPVVDDGYQDQAVELLGDHKPSGPLRAGKYSIYDGGTRIPFIVYWPGHVRPGTSEALVCQVDLAASFTGYFGKKLPADACPDSRPLMNTFLGKKAAGRDMLVEHSLSGNLAIIKGQWKLVEPSPVQKVRHYNGDHDQGISERPQLFDLSRDIGERHNLADSLPGKVNEMMEALQRIKRE